MDVRLNTLYKTLIRYFKTLSVLGYKKYSEVNKVLFLIFVDEYLKDPKYMAEYITEEDSKIIDRALNKIYGSTCLIDKPCNPS